MPFNLLGMGRAVLAVNCGVSVARAGSAWVDSGNNMGADHGLRGGGDQRFLGDLLMWGSGMEGMVGNPLNDCCAAGADVEIPGLHSPMQPLVTKKQQIAM